MSMCNWRRYGHLALVVLAGLLSTARADDVRLAYLDIEEFEPGAIRIVWKLPVVQGATPPLEPAFPDAFRATSERTRIATASAAVERWTMVCGGEPLAGSTIAINGLDGSAMDALVRIQLADGSLHRTSLRPTEPTAIIPSAGQAPADRSPSILRWANRWRYVLLFVLACLLSLNPRVSRRGIGLCALALFVGSLCGHAVGGLPLRDALFPARMPSEAEVKRVLGGLMLNTYRAFILEQDEEVYEVLARSVEGEFLHDVYVQNRESLQIDADTDALSIVDRLDVTSVDSMTRLENGAIAIVANWDVYGSVLHWDHLHFRCNTYKAELTLVPTDGYWKLSRMEVLQEERVM